MDSNIQQGGKRKKTKLKALLPQLALKTGLSQKEVAKVCRLLIKQIQASIENDEVFKTKILTIRSSLKKAKPENEKRGPVPERRIGRVVINPEKEQEQDNDDV
jgi:hypothetical protein